LRQVNSFAFSLQPMRRGHKHRPITEKGILRRVFVGTFRISK
jgi:hypothetical protein